MTTLNVKNFLNYEDIPHYFIWYYISSKTGKKTPIGEKNNENIEAVISKKNINPPRPTSYCEKIDGKFIRFEFNAEESASLQKVCSVFLKYTKNIYCVDIDDPKIKSMDDFIENTGCELFRDCCWTTGNTKGIHIYVKINNMIDYTDQQMVYKDFHGDLIKKNNMWEKFQKPMFNYENEIHEFEYDDIKHIFNDKILKSQPKPKITKKNISSPIEETTNETDNESVLTSDSSMLNIDTKMKDIENLVSCFSIIRATDYDKWTKVMFMIVNELGQTGEDIFCEFSKKSPTFNKDSCIKYFRQNVYTDKKKTKKETLINIGSGHLWAKDDNPTLYSQLFGKKTDGDLSVDSFKDMCEKFEKTHCKIINKSFFINHCDDGFRIMTEKQLITSYKHLTFKTTEGKATNFIESWLRNNNSIKCYDDIGVYPDKSKCPQNIFNIWEDFAMEKVETYTEHQEGLDFILNHIKILCKTEDAVFEYLMCYLAHIIQKPDEKSICPVLISKEGAGKSSLILLITLILGRKKMFETAKPSRDVWGDFNGNMKDCFFVNLNELSKKEMTGFEGQFKQLVTEPTITINEKGISQYVINSFHRFFITSNSEIPVKTGRRTFIIRCSDELIGNTKHFDKFYSLMEDQNVLKTFYEYLKNFTYKEKDMSCFREMMTNSPKTEYELEIRESDMSVPELFLKDMVRCNRNIYRTRNIEMTDKACLEYTGKVIFDMFNAWKLENGILKYDTTPQKLGVSISYLNLKGVQKGKHTREGDTKIYNIKLLSEHFGLFDELPTGVCHVAIPP
jgi:hypothetical protein